MRLETTIATTTSTTTTMTTTAPTTPSLDYEHLLKQPCSPTKDDLNCCTVRVKSLKHKVNPIESIVNFDMPDPDTCHCKLLLYFMDAPQHPCGLGEGDCDEDRHCRGDLVCGEDNCPASSIDYLDCCQVWVPTTTTTTTTIPTTTKPPTTIWVDHRKTGIIENKAVRKDKFGTFQLTKVCGNREGTTFDAHL